MGKTRILLIVFSMLLLITQTGNAQSKNSSKSYEANPVILEQDEYGIKRVMHWKQPSSFCKKCKNVWTDQEGSKIWFEDIDSGELDEILNKLAISNNLSNFKVSAKAPLKKANLLDQDGFGWTVMANASKGEQPFRLALLLVYGSLDDSPKTTGVHAYMAKENNFIRAGGWVVPATFWLGVDPTKDVGDLVKQGLKDDNIQVKVFSQLSDIWIENIFNLYVQNMQANLRDLHNFRISVIAADDPNATVIQGSNGFNEIEFNY